PGCVPPIISTPASGGGRPRPINSIPPSRWFSPFKNLGKTTAYRRENGAVAVPVSRMNPYNPPLPGQSPKETNFQATKQKNINTNRLLKKIINTF
ncbi:hypothetical protein, partial [Enterobacter mori]